MREVEAEDRSSPEKENGPYTVIHELYQNSYQNDPEWKTVIEDAKRRVLAEKPNITVSLPFIFYIFGRPEIAARFPTIQLKTLEAFGETPQEFAFFIDEDSNNIFATGDVQKPAAYDLPMPDIDALEAPRRQTIAMVHTHPPLGDILKPSVYFQHDGKEGGDLYTFSRIWELRAEAIAEGNYPPFAERPLSIIMHSDVDRGTEKILFILESDELAALSKDQYIDHLKKHKDLIDNSNSEEEVVKALREMGYKASMAEITIDALYSEFPILGNQFAQLLQDLGLINQ